MAYSLFAFSLTLTLSRWERGFCKGLRWEREFCNGDLLAASV